MLFIPLMCLESIYVVKHKFHYIIINYSFVALIIYNCFTIGNWGRHIKSILNQVLQKTVSAVSLGMLSGGSIVLQKCEKEKNKL